MCHASRPFSIARLMQYWRAATDPRAGEDACFYRQYGAREGHGRPISRACLFLRAFIIKLSTSDILNNARSPSINSYK